MIGCPAPFFSAADSLLFGADKDNAHTLKVMGNTLTFAEQMGENVQDADLVAAIQRLPGADEYRELQHSLRALQQKWQLQTDRQSHFAQETQLNSEQWHQRCENRLSALIACNEEAIAKPRWLNGWLNFIRISQDIENSGLQRIRDAIMSHTLTIEDIDTGLEVAIFDQLAREIATERPHLLRVSGNSRSAMQKNVS